MTALSDFGIKKLYQVKPNGFRDTDHTLLAYFDCEDVDKPSHRIALQTELSNEANDSFKVFCCETLQEHYQDQADALIKEKELIAEDHDSIDEVISKLCNTNSLTPS